MFAAIAAPTRLSTARLTLRRPSARDAAAVFAYGSAPEVTRFMAWPRHNDLADTRAFLSAADDEWRQRGVGPYLVEHQGAVVGSTGLHLATPYRAVTGYLLVQPLWGQGFATELALAMVELAGSLGVVRLEALCLTEHTASARVLEKAGFAFEGVLRAYLLAPNLPRDTPSDVRSYARILR